MKIAFLTNENKGVKTYRAAPGSMRDNLELLTAGKLPVVTPDQMWTGHGIGGSYLY